MKLTDAMRLLYAAADDSDGCWIWPGTKLETGYGCLSLFRKSVFAHRFSWGLHNGPIPPGLCVMHVCDNPPCVNPAHLRLGTKAENLKDMYAKGRGRNGNLGKTHCVRGHEFTPENTLVGTTGRGCRQCKREYQREYMREWQRMRAAEKRLTDPSTLSRD